MNTFPRKALSFPYNDEIEQGLLGALLVHNGSFEKVCDFLKPEHFYVSVHGRIYAAISEMLTQGKTCTPALLKTAFAHDADLEGVGGVAYFADLASSVVTIMSVEDYGRSILELFQRRQLIEVCDETINGAQTIEPGTSAQSLLTHAEEAIYSIAEGERQTPQAVAFSSAIVEAINSAQAAFSGDPGAVGISTGLVDVDGLIGGLRKPDLVVLAGRPGMGKSALAMNIAHYVAKQSQTVAFFSLEMSAEQLATRVISAEANLSSDLVRRGQVSREQFHKFMDAGQKLAKIPLFIDESAGQTVFHIRNSCRRMKRKHGLALIVVDYIQLINSGRKHENRVQELTEITKALKNIAKEFECPVLALSQLSRDVEKRDDKRPLLSDLRDSGSIEQDADIVTFLYREEYYLEKAEPARSSDESEDHFQDRYTTWMQRKTAAGGKAEFIAAKNRHGATSTAYLHFDGPTTTFSNLSAVYSVAGTR
jgi:replicative DNA helicase